MAKSVTDLPPELLGRIFEYLGEHRPDISACRRVCKLFKELSSPFLITKIVLARRLTEIAKAQEVAAHPFFSRHVTTLIYDVSYFDPYSAEIYENYVDDCESIEDSGVRRFLDEEWYRRSKAEADYHKFLRNNTGKPCAEAARTYFWRLGTPISDEQAWRMIDLDSMAGAANQLADVGDRMGARQSFPIYKRLQKYHEDLDTNHEWPRIIQQVISCLPRLRHVHFTDYRELAREGECYMALCSRLFGNVREPERWNNLEHNGEVTEDILEAWNTIAEVKPDLRAVTLGIHPFEQRCNSTDPLALFKETQFLSTDELKDHPKRLNDSHHEFLQNTDLSRYRLNGDPIPSRDWPRLFNGLKSLRLPIFFEDSLPPANAGIGPELRRIFNAIPDTIVHLALAAKGPIDGFLQNQGDVTSLQTLQPFNDLVATRHFPFLRTLELEGWVTDYKTLVKVLGAHASTLRTLHLINIFCVGELHPSSDAAEFGEADSTAAFGDFIRTNLHLSGIEVYLFEHQFYPSSAPEESRANLAANLTSLVAGLDQESWVVDPLETTQGDWDEDSVVKDDRQFADDDHSQPDVIDAPRLERLCLDGRANLVHRRVRPGPSRIPLPQPLTSSWLEMEEEPRHRWCGPGYYWTRRAAYR
ncbi:hypothetical protein MBLNU13_g05238t3 [Cladosporium sp. NU13]